VTAESPVQKQPHQGEEWIPAEAPADSEEISPLSEAQKKEAIEAAGESTSLSRDAPVQCQNSFGVVYDGPRLPVATIVSTLYDHQGTVRQDPKGT
jgi:hypothetical protein